MKSDESDDGEESDDTEDAFLTRLDQEGDIVFKLYWDSGGPGAGAGLDLIYLLDGKYWTCDDGNQVGGPYDSLRTAMDISPLVGSATEAIYC